MKTWRDQKQAPQRYGNGSPDPGTQRDVQSGAQKAKPYKSSIISGAGSAQKVPAETKSSKTPLQETDAPQVTKDKKQLKWWHQQRPPPGHHTHHTTGASPPLLPMRNVIHHHQLLGRSRRFSSKQEQTSRKAREQTLTLESRWEGRTVTPTVMSREKVHPRSLQATQKAAAAGRSARC